MTMMGWHKVHTDQVSDEVEATAYLGCLAEEFTHCGKSNCTSCDIFSMFIHDYIAAADMAYLIYNLALSNSADKLGIEPPSSDKALRIVTTAYASADNDNTDLRTLPCQAGSGTPKLAH